MGQDLQTQSATGSIITFQSLEWEGEEVFPEASVVRHSETQQWGHSCLGTGWGWCS